MHPGPHVRIRYEQPNQTMRFALWMLPNSCSGVPCGRWRKSWALHAQTTPLAVSGLSNEPTGRPRATAVTALIEMVDAASSASSAKTMAQPFRGLTTRGVLDRSGDLHSEETR
jgi:hypothetical protein